MTKTLEPRDKLDAEATLCVVEVNGPEDAVLDWNAVDWRAAEAEVRRLRQRIFAATRAGDFRKVRSLQKLMLRSRSNTLISVRQAAERNAGRFTAGIDGQVALTALAKQRLVADIPVTISRPCGETSVYPQGERKIKAARHTRDLGSRAADSGASRT